MFILTAYFIFLRQVLRRPRTPISQAKAAATLGHCIQSQLSPRSIIYSCCPPCAPHDYSTKSSSSRTVYSWTHTYELHSCTRNAKKACISIIISIDISTSPTASTSNSTNTSIDLEHGMHVRNIARVRRLRSSGSRDELVLLKRNE